MTTLRGLVQAVNKTAGTAPASSLDIPSLAANIAYLTASGTQSGPLGSTSAILASLAAWTQQDDDAHDMCSLVACRDPLHPGPCKGWKGLLHSVSPGTYHQLENERVDKANARRLKRISDLKAQGKPIPRRLLTEIKPKPAPNHPAPQHNAHNVGAVPQGQVGQKADLAGGQAHQAGQAINKAAGITPNTAPLPTGPKGKKPSVAGRGPAFVITQPKVTDSYKLDKASKITPAEWDALSGTDKNAIRDELEAIKQRGFGPQQTKADALLAKLPAQTALGQGLANMLGKKLAPGTPGTVTTPSRQVHQKINLPGKTSLGQAVKTPQLPAPPPAPTRGTRDGNGILNKPHVGGNVTSTAVGLPKGYQISRDNAGYSLKHNGKLIRTSADQAALEKYAHDHAKGNTSGHAPSVQDRLNAQKGVSGTPSPSTPAPPASSPGLKPSAPLPPGTAPHVQHAVAVANRTAPKASMGKTHVDAYGKLTKAEFDALPADKQKTIRDDLANAKAKFLDPKKQQAAKDLLDRFGSRHTGPTPNALAAPAVMDKAAALHLEGEMQAAPSRDAALAMIGHLDTAQLQKMSDHLGRGTVTPGMKPDDARNVMVTAVRGRHLRRPAAVPAHPKGYSDPVNEAVKAASTGTISTDDVLKTAGRLSPDSVKTLDDADRKKILGRLAFVATHPKATPEQKAKAAAIGRMMNGGSPALTSRKWDHTPTFDELHDEEKKSGIAAKSAALAAANATSGAHGAGTMTSAARVAALAGMTKAQFDSLKPDEQRKITDALQELHYTPGSPANNYTPSLDKAAGDALTAYTGQHPGVHRLQQAEADFRAGKITGGDVHTAFLHARVQAPPNTDKTGHAAVEAEAARIAKDNPTLPAYARVKLAGDAKYNNAARGAIDMAGMEHNWTAAPRLSGYDIDRLFHPTDADLAAADPIHAQAVRELQEHVLTTGLAPGSPWSDATKDAAVSALLHVDSSSTSIDPDRLKQFKAFSPVVQGRVERTLNRRMEWQTHVPAKLRTYLLHQDLIGANPSADTRAVVADAANGQPLIGKLDLYRKLDPHSQEFQNLPPFVKAAIGDRLNALQKQVESNVGGQVSFGPSTDPFTVMPAALRAHLDGTRSEYFRREEQNASDVANYGTKIVDPFERVTLYNQVPITRFKAMGVGDQHAITSDLDKISHDSGNTMVARYNAQFTHDVVLSLASPLNVEQLVAVGAVNPAGRAQPDSVVDGALTALTKAEFDSLDPTFREAIDQRVMALPGPSQQAFKAKFHPAVSQAANPSGFTPTSQANVPPHVQAAIDTIYGVHRSGKSHTMAHQLATYGALRGGDFNNLNGQEQNHLLADLSFIATTAKGPSADKARKLIDRFTPPGTPAGQVPTGAVIPPANAVAGQVRYATPLKGLAKAKDSGSSGDGWFMQGGQRVWGKHGAAGLMLQHVDPQTGEKRYLMVQRGPAISDPGKWTFPGGASDSKETPHEGATRETIEELGLKDDVFKDALVHGDHTFTIPGSNWKYTSVAAQVPTMIKPNLSTAHARAETSDAKWMTLAEIQALDKAGKLHHPIAGGKLEQNVLSLYPQGSGVTLGQVARPGPVTTRPKRLPLPPGGRQAPATFNAWPHAHKPSKGKNLVPDKAAIDAMRQKIKQDRKLYDGKTADGRLAAIGAAQGFDDTPTVVSKSEIDRLLATGDYIEAFRGVVGAGGSAYRSRGGGGGKTAEQINEEMRSGPAYYGKGIFGNGYYLATDKNVARQYADGTKGSIVRMLIPKTAVTQKYDKVEKEAQANSSRLSKAKGGGYDISTFWDPGRWGAAKGLDGIEILPHHRAHAGGGASHVAKPGKPAFNWLNRSVLIVQKEPG